METILNQLFVGLSIASILLLVALGLTFTFGQMNVINMAHGEFIMAGAYTTYVLQTALGTGAITLAFGLGLPAAFVVAGTLGLILEFTVIRRLYGRPLDTLSPPPGLKQVLPSLVEVARRVHGLATQMTRKATALPECVTWFKRLGLVGRQPHDLGGIADRRDGVPQFVGEHRQELVFAAVGFPQRLFNARFHLRL